MEDTNYQNMHRTNRYLNMAIPVKDICSVINNAPKNKAPDPDNFIGEFYQTFKEEMIPILYNTPQKNRSRGNTW